MGPNGPLPNKELLLTAEATGRHWVTLRFADLTGAAAEFQIVRKPQVGGRALTKGEAVEACTSWRTTVMSAADWVLDDDPPSASHMGASGGFFVRDQARGRRAFYKPTSSFPPHTPWPAVEKICADLAHDLGLPIPPVLLWRRPAAPEGQEARGCVSLVLSDHVSDIPPDWKPQLEERAEMVQALVPGAGIIALDTFVHNVDRSDFRPNTVFYSWDESPSYGEPWFIDFGNCLNRHDRWMKSGWAGVTLPTMPTLLRKAVDWDGLVEPIERIEALSDDTIVEVVGRIPDDYLTPERRSVVTEALLERRHLVRPVLESEFG